MSIITLNSNSGTRNLGDTSFSLYLNGGEETFVFKPKDSDQIQTHEPFHLARKKAEDREIDVFTADKYFNESTNDGRKTKRVQHKKKEPLQVFDLKEKTVVPARSVHSESSWNSRIALLHNNIPRNQQQPFRKSSNKKGFLSSIGCNCSCNDNNSVETDDDNYLNKKSIMSTVDIGKEKQELESHDTVAREDERPSKKFEEIRVNLKTDNNFSFPNVKMESQEEDDLTPKSLEVFGSPVLENAKNSLTVEKKLNMLNWDTISPRVEEIDMHPSSNGVYNDSGSDSDSSSDLFEIESFSRNTNPILSRQESDGNSISSCITPTTCYAPSEASIEWSVITASAADFSAMSDADELRSTTTVAAAAASAGFSRKTVINPPKWRRPSILSGCKNNAAVRVTEDAFPSVRRHHQPESFPSGNKMAAFNKRNGQKQNLFISGSLSRSHSGSAAHLLYIQ